MQILMWESNTDDPKASLSCERQHAAHMQTPAGPPVCPVWCGHALRVLSWALRWSVVEVCELLLQPSHTGTLVTFHSVVQEFWC